MDRKTDSVSVPGILGRMSPEALSELIFNIANTLVSEGKAGTLTADLIPPQAKFAVMRPRTARTAIGRPTRPCSWPRRPA